MATQTAPNSASTPSVQSVSFERFAGMSAILAGIAALLYSISFVILHNTLLSPLFLMLSALLSTAALVAVYHRVRETDAAFALWALLLSFIGALGAAVHGGYDLANAINHANITTTLPSEIDPRGLLTFGVTGLGLLGLAWLIGHSRQFPRGLSYWGYLLGVLLIVLYVAYLILVDTKNLLIAGDVVLIGFVVNPVWYLWLGYTLWRGRSAR
jgi:hypothetical protein